MGKKFHWQHRALTILCVVLALILAGLLVATVFLRHYLSMIGRFDDNDTPLSPEYVATMTDPSDFPDPNFTGPSLDPTDVSLSETQAPPIREEAVVSILLIGQDRRPGESRQRSDAMILCTFHKTNKTVTLTSFLRDTYIRIPGYRAAKLNAAYQWGGSQLLKKTIKENFGIAPDACIEVDFSGFQKLIDLLGGVDISLTKAEADHLNKLHGWTLTKGTHNLTGEQALAYARIRAIGNDFGRTQRQRNILLSLLNKSQGLKPNQLTTLLEQALPLLTTDMSDGDILRYATQLVPLLSGCSMQTLQIPANGMYQDAWVGKQSVLIPDLEKNRQLLHNMLTTGVG